MMLGIRILGCPSRSLKLKLFMQWLLSLSTSLNGLAHPVAPSTINISSILFGKHPWERLCVHQEPYSTKHIRFTLNCKHMWSDRAFLMEKHRYMAVHGRANSLGLEGGVEFRHVNRMGQRSGWALAWQKALRPAELRSSRILRRGASKKRIIVKNTILGLIILCVTWCHLFKPQFTYLQSGDN